MIEVIFTQSINQYAQGGKAFLDEGTARTFVARGFCKLTSKGQQAMKEAEAFGKAQKEAWSFLDNKALKTANVTAK